MDKPDRPKSPNISKTKDKIIHHLSHELKTPISVLSGSLAILEKNFLKKLPQKDISECERIFNRAHRNLQRLLNMQYQIEDIVKDKNYNEFHLLSNLLYACTDQLEVFITEHTGGGEVINRIRRRIDEIFGPRESKSEKIRLDTFISDTLRKIGFRIHKREGKIVKDLHTVPLIFIPPEVLSKTAEGLIKNALENSPDKGEIKVTVKQEGDFVKFEVKDYGMGISKEDQKMIFENYFTTYETALYSSKQEYDFGSGGKGFDLLRTKIFSDQYNFKIKMQSAQCRFIKEFGIQCPGNIDKCKFCERPSDCFNSGGTVMTILFPIKKKDL